LEDFAMRVTTKGQVTIPQRIREKLGIVPSTEVDFVEEKNKVFIVKKKGAATNKSAFRKARGIASVRMTTDEIMELTRG
jgi:AbrB family looped-hinge helix DNA binding protein